MTKVCYFSCMTEQLKCGYMLYAAKSQLVRCSYLPETSIYTHNYISSKVTAPQDAHGGLVLQVYLGLNTLEFSATPVYAGKIFVSRL